MNVTKIIMSADAACGYVNKLHTHGQIVNMNPIEHQEFIQNLQFVIDEIRNLRQKRVLVCGGRKYANYESVKSTLEKIKPDLIIQGGAKGADTLAREWAIESKTPQMEMLANWDKFDNAAGPIRNQWTLDFAYPNKVIAFPGHSGTADMVERAKKANIDVEIINE